MRLYYELQVKKGMNKERQCKEIADIGDSDVLTYREGSVLSLG